ncbi:hypothetical protein JXA32_07575 [Candidatus Sumerlaeota bacterium]|nr:hypothetical protein [Candidatus Sumerlaeota bacterium]
MDRIPNLPFELDEPLRLMRAVLENPWRRRIAKLNRPDLPFQLIRCGLLALYFALLVCGVLIAYHLWGFLGFLLAFLISRIFDGLFLYQAATISRRMTLDWQRGPLQEIYLTNIAPGDIIWAYAGDSLLNLARSCLLFLGVCCCGVLSGLVLSFFSGLISPFQSAAPGFHFFSSILLHINSLIAIGFCCLVYFMLAYYLIIITVEAQAEHMSKPWLKRQSLTHSAQLGNLIFFVWGVLFMLSFIAWLEMLQYILSAVSPLRLPATISTILYGVFCTFLTYRLCFGIAPDVVDRINGFAADAFRAIGNDGYDDPRSLELFPNKEQQEKQPWDDSLHIDKGPVLYTSREDLWQDRYPSSENAQPDLNSETTEESSPPA